MQGHKRRIDTKMSKSDPEKCSTPSMLCFPPLCPCASNTPHFTPWSFQVSLTPYQPLLTQHIGQSFFILLFKGDPNNVRGPLWKWRVLQSERVQKGDLERRTWQTFIWYRKEVQYNFCVHVSVSITVHWEGLAQTEVWEHMWWFWS